MDDKPITHHHLYFQEWKANASWCEDCRRMVEALDIIKKAADRQA
jgi:thiol-disulfide isomerase/thioredoxin